MNGVLLVDDDLELVELLRDYLQQEGFAVEVAHDGETGLAMALAGSYSIMVLDIMLPRLSGMEVLRQLREKSRLPVLMLTARGDDVDRIIGLEQGADDYVPKPCTAREISARIRAILRRTGDVVEDDDTQPIQCGELTMWPDQRRASWHDAPLELTSTEFNLLSTLARNAGRTVSKAELSEQALGRPLQKFDRSIEVHLSKIREKLGLMSDGRSVIQTVFRQGYQFIRLPSP
ncbi:MAG: DNA-binding response regulator [Candidatus Dactylopiibacterium carminicum]|uniref:DNA-binding response regulator n=1 Tax=Candidatus Dactylopiibacterium carminicum TaxID=857335 RepID=A0A272ERS0_9RHOO|nr:response regulator transcription factor [Candidatus Dactylopiibacterium carminicum]KAF7598893.1 DNA-binding response regulator [Candidatus Dactylopiibacterium carminicum]PAS92808.1 MAG: DNA-binding response regulator [Candidatus Dactylopiibacterium carminicum]PAS96260.1 MAG: DNA-binding response regulator [Candidatus Dactylopiibacterium carminicum]PAS98911.1 MAG: DNA-binding response regulator [Candidatus Dactylopiibacterium carminicum]